MLEHYLASLLCVALLGKEFAWGNMVVSTVALVIKRSLINIWWNSTATDFL